MPTRHAADGAALLGTSSGARTRWLHLLTRRLATIAAAVDAHCLIEIDGAVVAHATVPAPEHSVVAAIVDGSVDPLQATVTGRRTVGVVGSGPVERLDRTGSRCAYVAALDDARSAWLWLLPSDDAAEPSLVRIDGAAAQLGDVFLPGERDDATAVLRWLNGEEPASTLTAGSSSYWIAAARCSSTRDAIRLADVLCTTIAVDPIPRCDARAVAVDDTALVVICARTTISEAGVVSFLTRWAARASRITGTDVLTGLSREQHADAEPQVPHAQALAAATVADVTSGCVPVADVRTRVVAGHLSAAARTLPNLGDDPVRRLEEHDSERAGDLVPTVRAWLEHGGDVKAAAVVMGVHHNTLRYRIAKAESVAGTSFTDPYLRAELLLRLPR